MLSIESRHSDLSAFANGSQPNETEAKAKAKALLSRSRRYGNLTTFTDDGRLHEPVEKNCGESEQWRLLFKYNRPRDP